MKHLQRYRQKPVKVFKNLHDSFIETCKQCKGSIYSLQGTSKPLRGFSTNLT